MAAEQRGDELQQEQQRRGTGGGGGGGGGCPLRTTWQGFSIPATFIFVKQSLDVFVELKLVVTCNLSRASCFLSCCNTSNQQIRDLASVLAVTNPYESAWSSGLALDHVIFYSFFPPTIVGDRGTTGTPVIVLLEATLGSYFGARGALGHLGGPEEGPASTRLLYGSHVVRLASASAALSAFNLYLGSTSLAMNGRGEVKKQQKLSK